MRKKLLSLVAMAFVAIGICAQTWTEPALPEPAAVGSDPISGHAYRLKHVQASIDATERFQQELIEAEQEPTGENIEVYMSGGQVWFNWNTTAVLTEYPEEAIAFTFIKKTDGEGNTIGWDMKCYDYTWAGKYLFISGNGIDGFAMHVDGANPTTFELLKQDNGYYHIRANAADATYGKAAVTDWESKCLTWRKGDETYPLAVYAALIPDDNEIFGDWEFIDMNLHIYDAQLKLYNLAVAIENEELGVDYEQYTAAYESTDYEALTEALDQLSRLVGIARVDKYLKYGEDGMNPPSDDNPANATQLIQNPDFETGNIDGWTCTFESGTNATNIGYQANGNNPYTNGEVSILRFIEAWANAVFNPAVTYRSLGDAELEQTMYNLPEGKYVFSCDAIANQQDGHPCSGVQLFAIGGEADTFQEIATGNGLPEHFELTFASTGGDITLGLRTRSATANWIAADNFTLTYYGKTTLDPAKIALDALIEKCVAQYGEDGSLAIANNDVKAAYAAAIAAAQAATSDYTTQTENVNAAVAALKASIADYDKLAATIEEWDNKAAALDGTKWAVGIEDITDKLQEMMTAYEEGTYTAEDIDAASNELSMLFAQTIGGLVEKGDDLTFLLVNPGFDTDQSGWEITNYDGTGPVVAGNHRWGGQNITLPAGFIKEGGEEVTEDEILVSGCNEIWKGAFKYQQTIANMPPGLYTLSCKGFQRNELNQSDTSVPEGAAELFAITADGNVQIQKFANIFGDCSANMLYNGTAAGEEGVAYGGGIGTEVDLNSAAPADGYYPNGMCGASAHFAAGYYKQQFDFKLTEISDVIIGARCQADYYWTLFDDFQIVYKGDDADAYLETVERLVGEAEKLLKQNEDGEKFFATLAITQLDNAVQAGNQVIDDIESCTKEDAEAAIEQLKAAIEYAKESSILIEQLYNMTNEFNDMRQNSGIESENPDFENLINEIYGLNDQYESNEQIKEYMTALRTKWVVFVVNQTGFAEGTQEDPLYITEVIFNPSFEQENAENWTIEPLGENNQYQGATYTNAEEGIEISKFVECWIPDANGTLSDGKVYQQLAAALPAGYYILECDGYAVNQGGYPEEGIQGAYLMATDGNHTWQTPMAVAEGVTEGKPLHFSVPFESDGENLITIGLCTKDANVNWIAADNFSIAYIGTTAPDAIEGVEADIIATSKAIAIYNLAGQRVQKAVRGLYIINGKKVIVK